MNVSAHTAEEAHALKCELAGEVLRSSASLRFRVSGWSMMPSVRPGDTLIVHRASGTDLRAGDIVVFGRDRRLFAHRLVANLPNLHFITRGDAMPAADPVLGAGEILGRVSMIVRDGKSIAPEMDLGYLDRAIAALVRSSPFAARLIAGLHTRYQSRKFNSKNRAITCQN